LEEKGKSWKKKEKERKRKKKKEKERKKNETFFKTMPLLKNLPFLNREPNNADFLALHLSKGWH
jgi:hypothetical protein